MVPSGCVSSERRKKRIGRQGVVPYVRKNLSRVVTTNWYVKSNHAGQNTRSGMMRPDTKGILLLHLGTGNSVCPIRIKGRGCTSTGCIASGGVCREGPQIRFWGFDMALHCRHRLPTPQAAGYETKEALLEAISAFPHLRPCPKANWWWLDKKRCQKCRNRVEVKLEGREENGRTENAYAR